jgi:TatA/E family protein of Tat protein translocase
VGIGVFEILIILLIVLILFGGYKRLPGLGRSAGTGARKGGEKAKELAGQIRTKAEGVDTAKIGESVGRGLRDAREVRDSVKGVGTDSSGSKAGADGASEAAPDRGESGDRAGDDSRTRD